MSNQLPVLFKSPNEIEGGRNLKRAEMGCDRAVERLV